MKTADNPGLMTVFGEPLIWLFGLGAVCMGGGDISTFVFLPKIGSNTVVDITQHQAHLLTVFVGVSAVALRFGLLITLLSSSAFLLLPRVLAASEGRIEGRVVSAGLV